MDEQQRRTWTKGGCTDPIPDQWAKHLLSEGSHTTTLFVLMIQRWFPSYHVLGGNG